MVVGNARCSLIGLVVIYVCGLHWGAYEFRMANTGNRSYHHLCRAVHFYLALPPPGGRSARTFQAVGATVVEARLARHRMNPGWTLRPYRGGAVLDVRGSWTRSWGPCFGTTLVTYGNSIFYLYFFSLQVSQEGAWKEWHADGRLLNRNPRGETVGEILSYLRLFAYVSRNWIRNSHFPCSFCSLCTARKSCPRTFIARVYIGG